MSDSPRPTTRPQNACFSSGPCAKRPGWTVEALQGALTGRSHRSAPGKARLQESIDRMKALLGLPDNYLLGIVPGSDTGAVEMALWSLLGERGVDVPCWESFGAEWATDITDQLHLDDVRVLKADYGQLPDLSLVDCDRDVVFTWNGTTSGVRVPDADWIKDDRKGLTICDATSAVFSMEMPWEKLDVVTFSWQKALGGEAAHGVLILSPRAVERLESYTPPWPMPKVFRLTKKNKLIAGIFKGATINTPSMLCVEDAIDALKWMENNGGLPRMIERSQENLAAVSAFVEKSDWAAFLPDDETYRSSTSICLKIVDSWFTDMDDDGQAAVIGAVASLMEKEQIAFDIKPYRDAPAGFRLWGGAMIDAADMAAVCAWLDWAWAEVKREKQK